MSAVVQTPPRSVTDAHAGTGADTDTDTGTGTGTGTGADTGTGTDTDTGTDPDRVDPVLRVAVQMAHGGRAPSRELTVRLRARTWTTTEVPGEWFLRGMEEVLLGPSADDALQWLQEAGLLGAAFPEVDATVDFAQEMGRRHKDVWKHTKQVVAQAVRERTVRWAALLHDIGKVPTRAVTPQGKVTFHGHPEVGARLFDRIARRLGFPKPLRGNVRFLILHHLRANQYDGKWTDSAVRRFDREMGEHLGALLQLSRADITSAHRHRREVALQQIDELWKRIESLREFDRRVPPLPSGLGNQIMKRFGLAAGPRIGELRHELEQAVEMGRIEPHQDAEYYLDYLVRNHVVDNSST
jgi:poly(A) polymerase